MHINLNQTNGTFQNNGIENPVPSNLVEKLYNLCQRHKNNIITLDESTRIVGKFHVNYTYRDYITEINTVFPSTDLIIEADGYYILFADKKVEQILIDNFADAGVNGVTEDLRVNAQNGFYNNGQVFRGNTEITSFNELSKLINVTKLGNESFLSCTNLESIDLSNIIYLAGSAFRNCPKLAIDVNCPNLTTLSADVFYGSGIVSISSLGNISTIGNNAFCNCSSLEVINNNALENVQEIQSQAFVNCTSLINTGNLTNVKIFRQECFCNCGLESIGDLSNALQIENSAFSRNNNLVINNLSLPNLISLGNDVFRSTKVKQISNLGNTITRIEYNTFYDCQELTSITNNALSNITYIGGDAFYNCKMLTTIGATPNLTTIGTGAFRKCTLLASIDLPNSIQRIDNNAFMNDSALVIDDLNLPNLTILGAEVFRDTKVKQISDLGSITIIPDSCFYNCTSLITVSNSVMQNITKVGHYGFYNCNLLRSIDLSNVQTIGQDAFSNCSLLTSINCPNITSIRQDAFRKCQSLQTITGLNNITVLENGIFADCTALQIADIDFSKIKQLSSNAFYGCHSWGSGITIDVNLEQNSYPYSAFHYTLIKKLIVHLHVGSSYNNIEGNYDNRYPIHEICEELEYLDYSDTNFYIWACLYANNNTPMKTVIWPSTIVKVDWRWSFRMPNLQHFIILVEDPNQITADTMNGTGAYSFNGGSTGEIPSTCNIYVKDAAAQTKYLNHSWWGTIPNASTRIKTLSELPVGVWTTGLYKSYEPYLSHQDDPAYANLPY